MAVRSFRIATDRIGPLRWCWVRLHPTVEHLVAAKRRLNPACADPEADEGMLACWQPTSFVRDSEGREVWPGNGYAGLVRLADGDATTEIVAHELVHAALAVYRMNVCPDVRSGRDIGVREEDLAYIYGELFASFQEGWEALNAA